MMPRRKCIRCHIQCASKSHQGIDDINYSCRHLQHRAHYSWAPCKWIPPIIPRGITQRLRIAPHIRIGVHPLLIALHTIDRQEHPHHWIIIPRVVIVQSRHRTMDLPGVTFGRADAAGHVAAVPIGAVDLLAQDCAGTEAEQHAAQRIGQIERGGGAVEGTIGASSSKAL
jgi:hypothetical protein